MPSRVHATILALLLVTAPACGNETTRSADQNPSASRPTIVRTDTEVSRLVKTRLEANPYLAPLQIEVETNDGVVSLRSTHDTTEDERELAVLLARHVTGVRYVVDVMR